MVAGASRALNRTVSPGRSSRLSVPQPTRTTPPGPDSARTHTSRPVIRTVSGRPRDHRSTQPAMPPRCTPSAVVPPLDVGEVAAQRPLEVLKGMCPVSPGKHPGVHQRAERRSVGGAGQVVLDGAREGVRREGVTQPGQETDHRFRRALLELQLGVAGSHPAQIPGERVGEQVLACPVRPEIPGHLRRGPEGLPGERVHRGGVGAVPVRHEQRDVVPRSSRRRRRRAGRPRWPAPPQPGQS